MATEVRRPIWKRPTAIAGAVIPLIVAVVVAVLASVGETPRLDASSEARLRASLERMTAGMSDAQKKEFYADCIELTLPDTMKSAFQLTFLHDRPLWSNGPRMFKPLKGMTAAEIHRKAEGARRASRVRGDQAAVSQPTNLFQACRRPSGKPRCRDPSPE